MHSGAPRRADFGVLTSRDFENNVDATKEDVMCSEAWQFWSCGFCNLKGAFEGILQNVPSSLMKTVEVTPRECLVLLTHGTCSSMQT